MKSQCVTNDFNTDEINFWNRTTQPNFEAMTCAESDKLFQSGELRDNALGVLTEIFTSCSTALTQPDLGRETPPSVTPKPETLTQLTSLTEKLVGADDQEKIQNDEVSETASSSDSVEQTVTQPRSKLSREELSVHDSASLSLDLRTYPELVTKNRSENISPQTEFLTEEQICTVSVWNTG